MTLGCRWRADAIKTTLKAATRPSGASVRLLRPSRRLWKPRKIYLKGNHEIRADRVASEDPKLFGTIGSDDCDVRDFERFQFLERVWEQGVVFSHYFQNPHSSRPIGGNIENMLTKVG